MPNRLIDENSPYLLQHADNPVDWYPWTQEALDKARDEDKPIFLSIGYAACHWCHVMAHESFENSQTAAYMNEHFINIKVDREERPDLDSIYMNAVVAMTGQGGWPMSVFLTPGGKPFYGGTYYPPVRRYNMPSFQEVLQAVKQTWQNDRQGVLNTASKINEYLQQANQMPGAAQRLQPDTAEEAAFALAQSYDWKYGGWGSAPKFPQPMAVEFLLQRAQAGDHLARDVAVHALQSMSAGGMYDVVGGGFARYSTDNSWLVPHFEKMLYDNAQLSRAYLHAFLVTGEDHFRRICEETLDFILRELTHPQGGFYSSLDADSEGEEGKFYVWTWEELNQIFSEADDLEFLSDAYQITKEGNFEGKIVLQRAASDGELAEQCAIEPEEVHTRLDMLHRRLLRARQQRIRPETDDKVLTSWNSLAMAAFAEAGRYLNRADYLAAAQRNAEFILQELFVDDRLYRSWRAGKAQHSAYLEDHAGLILALLSLYQSDFDNRWYSSAERLTRQVISHFRDLEIGFYDTRDDHENLITRPKDIQDNATPCGNSLAAAALLHMAAYAGETTWVDTSEAMLASIQDSAARYPTAFGNWLCAIDISLRGLKEVALVGDSGDSRMQEYLHTLRKRFRPHLVVAQSSLPLPESAPPLLAGRGMLDMLPTAYICQNFVCQRPVNSPEAFEAQLENA